jgi:hypothetical protein
MKLLFDLIALGAVALTAYLLFLLFFEPGIYYRIRGPVRPRTDEDLLQLLATVLGTTPQRVESVELLSDGTGLYHPQVDAIRRAQHSVHMEAYIFYPGLAVAGLHSARERRDRPQPAGSLCRELARSIWRTARRRGFLSRATSRSLIACGAGYREHAAAV